LGKHEGGKRKSRTPRESGNKVKVISHSTTKEESLEPDFLRPRAGNLDA